MNLPSGETSDWCLVGISSMAVTVLTTGRGRRPCGSPQRSSSSGLQLSQPGYTTTDYDRNNTIHLQIRGRSLLLKYYNSPEFRIKLFSFLNSSKIPFSVLRSRGQCRPLWLSYPEWRIMMRLLNNS